MEPKPGPHPGLAALIEVGVMFLPAIPAYLWIWPRVEGVGFWVFQSLAYVYVLAGTLYIGLGRWSWRQLGVNRAGMGLSLACAASILAGRLLIIRSVNLGLGPPGYSAVELIGGILFYLGLVAVVEELLYRGLIYRALDDWLGVRWAIWGSSFGFLLWHIVGQGPIIGLTAFFFGLLFALLRLRAGGLLGVILLHGLFDVQTFLLVSPSNQEVLERLDAGRPEIFDPNLLLLGVGLILLVPIYLWLVHLKVTRWGPRRTRG